MNISSAASLAAAAGYQTGETPLEVRVALLKTSLEEMQAEAGQLIQEVELTGDASRSDNELDTYA